MVAAKKLVKGLAYDALTMRREIVTSLVTLISAAFGFIAAFAWNESMKAVFLQYYGEAGGIAAKFGYAVVVSLIAVVIIVWLGRIKGRLEQKTEEICKK